MDDLSDRTDRRGPRSDFDQHRFCGRSANEILDLAGHGRREEEILATSRQCREDPADIGKESHVEHPIRLVENDYFDSAEVDLSAIDVVEETTWCCDEQVESSRQATSLRLHAGATKDDGASEM